MFYIASKYRSLSRTNDYIYALHQGHLFTTDADCPSFENKPLGHYGTIHRLEYGPQRPQLDILDA
jgi:hypothetical protein